MANIEVSEKLYAKLNRLAREAKVTPNKYIHMLLSGEAKSSEVAEVIVSPSYSTSQ